MSTTSWRAYSLMLFGNLDFSHAAMVIQDNNKLKILQSAPKDKYSSGYVSMLSIKNFFSDVTDYQILRHDKLSMNFNISSDLNKSFDFDFNRIDSSKIYCTELIDNIIYKNGFLRYNKNKEYIWPSELGNHLLEQGFYKVLRN
ncbi:MAG: hypothetical protein U9N59_00370 [Campylobacterota bacterium]|nr:hypothetical protein [Campylobacterota bacterium]